MSLKKKKKILDLMLIVVFLPVLVGAILGINAILVMALTWALAIAWVILHGIWWRCPHCTEHLGRYGAKVTYCPHCGEKVELNDE